MPCTITINTHALDMCSIGDRDVRKYLQERYGIADSIKVQELEKEKRTETKPRAMMLASIAEVRRRSIKGQTR